jgi:hypothetical protein
MSIGTAKASRQPLHWACTHDVEGCAQEGGVTTTRVANFTSGGRVLARRVAQACGRPLLVPYASRAFNPACSPFLERSQKTCTGRL